MISEDDELWTYKKLQGLSEDVMALGSRVAKLEDQVGRMINLLDSVVKMIQLMNGAKR